MNMMNTDNNSEITFQAIKWSECFLCQEITDEKLTSPANSKRTDSGVGYTTIADNILQYSEFQTLPFNIDIENLTKDDCLESVLKNQKACWHKSCYSKINSTKCKRLQVKGQKRKSTEYSSPKKIYTRKSVSLNTSFEATGTCTAVCLFCGEDSSTAKLHEVSTFKLDYRVRKCAHDLKDQELIAKLSSVGDLMAQEAKYHAKCLAHLYSRAQRYKSQNKNEEVNSNQSIALAELITYIEECRHETDTRTFRLADLVKLYEERLRQLGEDVSHRIRTTTLKDRILWHLPELQAYKQGRDVFLSFNDDVASLLATDYFEDLDEQSMIMAKVASIIRNETFSKSTDFKGAFNHESQMNSIPQSLLTLINVILNGSNIKEQTDTTALGQPVLTAAQLLVFNCIKRRRKTAETSQVHHRQKQHPPLPLYVGLKVHSLTRQRDLIDTLFALGISESYSKVMDTISALGNNISEFYQSISVVCPPQLQTGLFVTAAADNIDHNPSSTTSTGSFHGTGLSLFQSTCDDVCTKC